MQQDTPPVQLAWEMHTLRAPSCITFCFGIRNALLDSRQLIFTIAPLLHPRESSGRAASGPRREPTNCTLA